MSSRVIFGSKKICPDQAPVPDQRSVDWMMAQIQHPDIMTQNDTVSKKLFAENNKTQMPNMHLTADEARPLVEYIRSGGK